MAQRLSEQLVEYLTLGAHIFAPQTDIPLRIGESSIENNNFLNITNNTIIAKKTSEINSQSGNFSIDSNTLYLNPDETVNASTLAGGLVSIGSGGLSSKGNIFPASNGNINLGSLANRWNQIYAKEYHISGTNYTNFMATDDPNNIYFYIKGTSTTGTTSLVITKEEVRRGSVASSINLGSSSAPWNNTYTKSLYITGTSYTNQISSDSSTNIYAKIGTTYSLVITNSEIRRGASASSINLGSSNYPWNNIYANSYYGTWNGDTVSVSKGGTGKTTLSSTYVLVGNGTSAITDSSAIQIPASGNITIERNLVPNADAGLDLGHQSYRWNNAYTKYLKLPLSNNAAVVNSITGNAQEGIHFDTNAASPVTVGYIGKTETGTDKLLAIYSTGQIGLFPNDTTQFVQDYGTIFHKDGITSKGDIVVTTNNGTNKIVKVVNSNGILSLMTSTNKGLYDHNTDTWMIKSPGNGSATYIPNWKSKGSNVLPVYFTSDGEPASITVYNQAGGVQSIGWASGQDSNNQLVTRNTIAYWNGAYASSGSNYTCPSNLQYFKYTYADSNGHFLPRLSETYNLGSSDYKWNSAYINNLTVGNGNITLVSNVTDNLSPSPKFIIKNSTLNKTEFELYSDGSGLYLKGYKYTSSGWTKDLLLYYSNASLNEALCPGINNRINLGSSSKFWNYGYFNTIVSSQFKAQKKFINSSKITESSSGSGSHPWMTVCSSKSWNLDSGYYLIIVKAIIKRKNTVNNSTILYHLIGGIVGCWKNSCETEESFLFNNLEEASFNIRLDYLNNTSDSSKAGTSILIRSFSSTSERWYIDIGDLEVSVFCFGTV